MSRLCVTAAESWRPPVRSHGLPGARCMRKNVMRMTKKTTGIIHRRRRMMKMVRLPALLLLRADKRAGSRAPPLGRPAITAKSSELLVSCDVRREVVLVAGCELVVKRRVRDLHVRRYEIVLVWLVKERSSRLVDQHLLSRQVVSVALALVQLAVGLLNERVVTGKSRAAKVEAVAGTGE